MQVRNSTFEKSVAAKIIQVAHALESEVERELKLSFALSFSQFRLLSNLRVLGEASQRDVAAALEVTPAVVTRQAEVLSARGLLKQRPNPSSKRENQLTLTKKGEEAALEAGRLVNEVMARLLGELSLQDETALGRGIESLAKQLAV